jgi:hypothetical protein
VTWLFGELNCNPKKEDGAGPRLTAIVVESLTAPDVALTVALPMLNPVARPFEFTITTALFV